MIGQRPQYVGSRHLSCAVFCQTVPFCTHVACLVRCQSSSRSFPFTFTLCSHTILMCPAQIHFWRHIFPKHLRLVQSRLSLTLLSILSRYFMLNIFMSIFVCVAARSFFTWLVIIHISVPCVIAIIALVDAIQPVVIRLRISLSYVLDDMQYLQMQNWNKLFM